MDGLPLADGEVESTPQQSFVENCKRQLGSKLSTLNVLNQHRSLPSTVEVDVLAGVLTYNTSWASVIYSCY